jgi:2-hydroxychromene-2-carboxylate isomerase
VAIETSQPVFFYDLGSPECYLAAELTLSVLPVVPEWEPVLAADLEAEPPSPDRASLSRRALQAELQPLRWPTGWPPDSERAMLAATYAKHIGRVVAFSLAAFRQAFAGGRDLGDESTILLAAAACEMHPTAVLRGLELRSVSGGLRSAGERARTAGVTALPAIRVEGEVFSGARAVEEAEAALAALR